MKKIINLSFILSLFIVLMSCNEEKGNVLSPVKTRSILGKLENNVNPFDYVGEWHNQLCSELMNTYTESNENCVTIDQLLNNHKNQNLIINKEFYSTNEHFKQFVDTYGMNLLEDWDPTWNHFNLDKICKDSGMTMQNVYIDIVNDPYFRTMDNKDQAYSIRILNAIKSCYLMTNEADVQFAALTDSINTIETEMLMACDSSNFISFITLSVAKHSTYLWSNYSYISKTDNLLATASQKDVAVVGADCAGALSGALKGAKAGMVGGPKGIVAGAVVGGLVRGAASSFAVSSAYDTVVHWKNVICSWF